MITKCGEVVVTEDLIEIKNFEGSEVEGGDFGVSIIKWAIERLQEELDKCSRYF